MKTATTQQVLATELRTVLKGLMAKEIQKLPDYLENLPAKENNGKRSCVSMHRFIMNCPKYMFVDHKNHNTLDNRKENLRIVTIQQNNMNKSSHKNSSSKYVGVSKCKNGKWQAKIRVNNKLLYLGVFNKEDDAAKTRDIATKKYFGNYGNLNFNSYSDTSIGSVE